MLNEKFKQIVSLLSRINEDREYDISLTEDLDTNNDEEKAKPVSTEIKEAIKPQVEIANSVIQSIQTAFADNCDQSKQIGIMEDQIKSWEEQIHGACKQIIQTIESKDGTTNRPESIVNDSKKCSPRAFNKYINNYSSRDYSTLDLASAIIVFYNSLT